MRTLVWRTLVVGALLGTGCGSDKKSCDPALQTGCGQGLVCEEVMGGEPTCFAPVEVKGRVFNLSTNAAITGARVVALDENGAPASTVAVTDLSGNYSLPVPAARAADGAPVQAQVTLRADAAQYETFPHAIRQAQPINLSQAVKGTSFYTVMTVQTEIGLLRLPSAGTAKIHGSVDVPPEHVGVLIVAEVGGRGYSAVADRQGGYVIFNVPAGSATVKAYAQGSSYDPVTVTLADVEDATVNLHRNTNATSVVSGSIQVVNPGAGSLTSVILVVESTFQDTIARGEAPAGLRAGDVSGAFSITGVPAGRYVVLAGFENDFLVRDPDTSIGGTQLVHIDVASGADQAISEGFKVTGSLDIISPGATAPEAVTGKPTLTWVDDSSEDAYHVTVFDAFGSEVWQKDLPKFTGGNASAPYEGPLDAGMVYQFRVTSIHNGVPISSTEDLKGVFFSSR